MTKLTKKQLQQRQSAQIESAKAEALKFANESRLPQCVWQIADFDYCAKITTSDADYVVVEGGMPVVTILPERYFA